MPIWINGIRAWSVRGMESEGRTGRMKIPKEGGASSTIVDMQAPAAEECPTASQPNPIYYNHTSATTCQREPCVRSKLSLRLLTHQ